MAPPRSKKRLDETKWDATGPINKRSVPLRIRRLQVRVLSSALLILLQNGGFSCSSVVAKLPLTATYRPPSAEGRSKCNSRDLPAPLNWLWRASSLSRTAAASDAPYLREHVRRRLMGLPALSAALPPPAPLPILRPAGRAA